MIKNLQKVILNFIFIFSFFCLLNLLSAGHEPSMVPENWGMHYEKSRDLIKAVENNDINLVKKLIKEGYDVNYQEPFGIPPYSEYYEPCVYRECSNSESPLMIAAKNNNLEIMQLLIQAGANVNEIAHRDEPHMGSTALRYAIDAGSLEAVKLLLNSGANPNELVDGGLIAMTKTGTSKQNSKIESWQIYLQDYNVRNNPLLTYAVVVDSSKEIVEALLNAGAEVNGTSPIFGYDWTALMLASISGNVELVEVLLKYNADKNLKNKDGQTALNLAKQFGQFNVINILQDIRTKPNDRHFASKIK